MKTKKILFLAFLSCFAINAYAQVSVSLSVNPNPSSQISTWVESPNLAVFTVVNSDATLEDAEYKIKVELFKDNTLVLSTNNNVLTQYLDLGMQTFFAEDIIPFTAVDIHASTTFQNDLLQTGMLPAGNYQFCVSLIGNFTTMPATVCQNMTITSFQMPELISPIANIDISSDLLPATIFSWSPMVPSPPPTEGLKYIISVVEVLANQTPSQAFLYNYPVIEEEILVGTQFIWPTTMEAPEETQQYAWSIKPVNFDDVAYQTSANGFVPPETFTVSSIVIPKSGEETSSNNNSTTDICECFEYRYFSLPEIMILGSENPSSFLNASSNMFPPANVSIPELTISQPEPIVYPRKVKIDSVLTIRDYLFDCISPSNEPKTIATATIKWDENHSETLANNGPFEHEYSVGDEAPDHICITFKIENRPSYPEFLCEKEVCVAVPQVVLDLNTVDASGTITAGSTFQVGEQGEFTVSVDSVGTTAGKHTGKGTVAVPWLASRVAVEFTDISIDAQLHLSSGQVKVKSYPSAPDSNQIGSVYVGALSDFANAQLAGGSAISLDAGLSVVNYLATPKMMPIEVTVGTSNTYSLVLDKMIFHPNKSQFDLLATVTLNPSNNNQVVGFRSKGHVFNPNNPGRPQRLEIVEDLVLDNLNGNATPDIEITFLQPTSSNTGCYIDFDENGFKEYGIQIQADFTRNWLYPVPDDGTSKSTATLSAVGTEWTDLILTGAMQEAQIVGTNDLTLLVDDMSWDMSDALNPPNITFPTNYAGVNGNDFKGFYMKQAKVILPKDVWDTPTGNQVVIVVDDMIIQKGQGLTFKLEANNVIQFGSAEISDLAVSIDTVYVEMESSSLVDAYVTGDIALPVDSPTNYNPLHYNALFHHQQGPLDSNYIQLTINPVGTISSGLFSGNSGDVSMLLYNTSAMSVYSGKVKGTGAKVKGFMLVLDGKFQWVNAPIGPLTFDTYLDFQDLTMEYNKNAPQNFYFNAGTWSLSQPQQFMSGFPVSITNIHYEPKQTTGNQLAFGHLNMDVVFNLSSDIGGATSLGIKTSIIDNSSNGGRKFEPKCDGAVIDSINVYADLAAVKIIGAIGIRSNDPVYGDGFIGTLSAEFKAGVTASALAEFGNTSYLNSSLYRYWRVEADATFPAPGIVFLPGMAFRGFGGGAYRNMSVTLDPSGTKYNFSPLKSNFGFKVKAVLATSPDEKSFNADCSLLAQFSQSNGITDIGFLGDFYVGSSLSSTSRAKAQVKGQLGVTYDFPQKHFNLSASVDVNAPPITTPTPAELVLDIDGMNNLWYFKFGEPTNLNTVNVMGISLYEYLMFGNDIDGPSGFTGRFSDSYKAATGSFPSMSVGSGGVGSNTATGKGFALGIGFEFDKAGDVIISEYDRSERKKCALYYDIGAGAELHLSFMEYAGSCGGYNPMGINGYRAAGYLGFYGTASASVRKYKDNSDHDIKWDKPIADIGAGAWIKGEFPNPYYAAGAIDGRISAFNDFITCSFHLEFETGTSCSNSGVVSTVSVTQGDAAADQQNLLVQYINPTQSFNFPTESPLAVKYGLVPDEVFDVAEQQADGSVMNRRFKLVVSRTLEMEDPITNSWSNVLLSTDENNLGEFLYTIRTPLTQAPGGNLSMNISPPAGNTTAAGSINNMVAGGGSNTGMGQSNSSVTLTLAYPPPLIKIKPIAINTTPGYDNLPPEPDPILNTLLEDVNYRFTVTATLKEYNGRSWLGARKANNTPVTQTVIKTFRTGDMQAIK